MEVSHMTPIPTSPTDGDDLCSIEVTDVVIDGVTLLICFCGLAGNGAVLWLLGCHIRKNTITIYILNLAVTDSSFLLFMVISSLLYMIENVFCSTLVSLKYLRSIFLLSLFSYNMGLYLLTAISIQRCGSIYCPLWYRCHHPERLSVVVCVLLWALSITVIATVTSLCLLHDHEHCQVTLICMYVLNLLLFGPAMLISCTILFIKVLCGSQQHQAKRLHIIIFLTVLFYLIFGLPLSLWSFYQQFGYAIVPTQVLFLLACINSTIKPFIYFLVGSCCRECSMGSLWVSLQRIFKNPEDNTACSDDVMMNTMVTAS